ncbi:cyclic nucleotide-binding domain-containing protein [Pedobacter sp. CFBP9032]|uniref:cyclic nucleotide-binding domain-containing protein n=1 Tax=Pedobacter sp. CFBP9032 TaxID=3096539 RepID=UPI002A6AFCD1|nr:cyclic nucleotide-binding domain-containing protein [Pedobacter sp. CFBP9032]MDY0904805.1 cyclic nucleotide-binding domain-containing protein [Pedobacter sp. CFBP9032]
MEGSKILIILDDADLMSKISKILTVGKYNVNSTNSGKRAMDIIRRYPVDIIISGIKLLEIDGFGVLRMVNKFVENAGVGFIMLLNADEHDLTRRVMELGADGYLLNHFDHGELLNQVEVRIRKKRLQREYFSKHKERLGDGGNKNDEMMWLKSRFDGLIPRMIRKHQVIYYPGDKVAEIYYILSGRVKTYVIDDAGNELITGVFGPGECFGLLGAILGSESMESAEAMDSAEISILKVGSIESILTDDTDLNKFFFRQLAKEVNESHGKLLDIAYYSVRKRIAKSILKFSKPADDSLKKNGFVMPRNDLACAVGIATETLSRVLGDFQREGLIEKDGNEIILRKPEQLKSMKN